MLNPQAGLGGMPRSAIFRRADASEAGLPVDRPLVSSARYFREREYLADKTSRQATNKPTRQGPADNTMTSASWSLLGMSTCATTAATSTRHKMLTSIV